MDRHTRRGLGLALGLGVGIGLMMGAAVMDAMPPAEPTDEEIRERARDLGLVDLTEIPGPRVPTDPEPVQEEETAPVEPPPPERIISFVVTPEMPFRDFAAMLKANGLIDDEGAFLQRVAEREVEDRLQVGVHTLKVGETPLTVDEIIDEVTGSP